MNLRFVAVTTTVLVLFAGRAEAQQGNRSSYYWHPSLSLENVSTEQLTGWLARVGITLPFPISGNVSFSLNGGVPLTALKDPQAYELDGTITSPRLTIQDVVIEQFAATVRYRDGVLGLRSVRFQLPKRNGEALVPIVSGQGTIDIVPAGDLNLSVSVENFDLARLSEFSGLDLQVTGKADGSATVRIANADFSNPANWSGSARLQATEIRSPGLYAPKAEAAFRLADRTVTFERFVGVVNDVPVGLAGALELSEDAKSVALNDVRLDIFGGSLLLRGRAPIGAPTAQDVAFEATNLDLSLLDRQLRPVIERLGLHSVPPLQGRLSLAFDGTVPFQKLGDYSLWRLRRTEIRSESLLVGPTAFENFQVAATFDGTNFSLEPFGWNSPASLSPDGRPGRVEARIAAQLSLLGRVEIRIQSTHTAMRSLAPLLGFSNSLEGFLDGNLVVGAPALALKGNPASLATWTAELNLTGQDLRFADSLFEFRRLQARWLSPMLNVQNVELSLAGSRIQATGSAKLATDRSSLEIASAQLTTEFGRANATGVIPLSADQGGKLSLHVEQGDAATLTRIVGPNVFSGEGPLNGDLEIAVDSAKTAPRLVSASGKLNGVIAGSFQTKLPISDALTAASTFKAGRASIDLSASAPISVLGRNITDAAIRAEWNNGLLDVARFGATVDGIRIGGSGKAAINDDFFSAKNVELDLLGGKARVDLKYPLKAAGRGGANFKIEGVDLAASKPFLSSLAPPLSGRIDASGEAEFLPAAAPDGAHPILLKADAAAPKLAIGNWRINRTTAAVRTEAGLATINLRGETLDGVVEWNGVEATPGGGMQSDDGTPLASRGTVTIRNVRLGRLVAAAPRLQISDDFIRGRLNAALHYTRRPSASPIGSGNVEITDLANRTGLLSRRLTSAIVFDGQRFRLPEVSGDMLDGRLRGLVVLNLSDMRNGAFYRGEVTGMSLPKFFPQIGADGDLFTGSGDIEVRGRISHSLTGAGTIQISRGSFAGLDVSSWRSPAEIAINFADYSGQFTIPQTSAQLAQGQLQGKLDYRWDTAGKLESSLDFSNVNLRGLLRSSSRLQSFGEGRTTGSLQLTGRSMRSLNDLNGSFSARLENTQPGSWPIFDQVLSLLSGVGGRALVFDKGNLSGVIGGGATRLNRLELVSQRARIVGSGSVRFNGSLDLDFTAFTGRTTVRGRGSEYLAAQLLMVANPSAAVLVRINQLLSDRVLALKVSGTVSAPVTRIKPGPTLTAEAARFLLEGIVPVPGATGSTGR